MGDEERDEMLLADMQGRLTASQKVELEQALASDAAFRAERDLAAAIRGAAPDEPGPGSLGWVRLRSAIRRDRTPRRALPILGSLRGVTASWRLAAAALGGVVIGQVVGFALSPEDRGPDRSPDDAFYQTAGASQAGPQATIAFAPDATEAQMRAALVSADAQVTAGPSALGLWTLTFEDEASRTAGLAILAADAEVVESIQAD